VSLGVSVDMIPAAVARARLVIAEVNPAMPRSMGDSTLHVSRIHHLVPVDVPVTELAANPPRKKRCSASPATSPASSRTAPRCRSVSSKLAHEALQYVTDRKDLGIHSEVVSDAILPLLEHGCLTGARKTSQPFKIVTSMALGSRALYDLIDRNPLFVFQPIDVALQPGHHRRAAQDGVHRPGLCHRPDGPGLRGPVRLASSMAASACRRSS
jgi:acyl-CoA hydrolase